MVMAETAPLPNDQQQRVGRRRPFTTWVKKLTNFKSASSSSTSSNRKGPSKHEAITSKASKKRASKNDNSSPSPCTNPYFTGRPIVPQPPSPDRSDLEVHFPGYYQKNMTRAGAHSNLSSKPSRLSAHSSIEAAAPRTVGAPSTAPTISTDQDAAHSIHAPSHMTSSVAGTSRTAGGPFDSRKGDDSTFSSPAPSVRSLTTTLTTIQSMVPNGGTHGGNASGGHSSNHNNNSQTIQFSQPFPTSSPASAIPPHLAPQGGNPTTYNSATANNLLTDNASILTLASSSKRRRRRSMDTDASVQALAPSSVWGGSRESLPLSVLSANMDGTRDYPPTPGLHQSTSRIAGNERTSMYSTTGIAAALPSERNSLYASKQNMGDGASIRSGFPGHGRAESINGSVAGVGVGSPLASPMEVYERDAVEQKDKHRAHKEG